jgi:hypothetical protein
MQISGDRYGDWIYKHMNGRKRKEKTDAENRILRLVKASNCTFLEDNGEKCSNRKLKRK